MKDGSKDNSVSISKEWVKHTQSTAIVSVFGSFLILIIAVCTSKAKLAHISALLLVGFGAFIAFFTLFLVTTTIPNYIFYKRMLKTKDKKYIAENIEKYGMNFLLQNLWFIWPREFDK